MPLDSPVNKVDTQRVREKQVRNIAGSRFYDDKTNLSHGKAMNQAAVENNKETTAGWNEKTNIFKHNGQGTTGKDTECSSQHQEAMKADLKTVARTAKAAQNRSKDTSAAESPWTVRTPLNKDLGWEWRPQPFHKE
ncbi:MAG: hypothetical protein Q9181_004304 [Wetmoreana brouardii]